MTEPVKVCEMIMHFPWYGLMKLPRVGVFRSAVVIAGALGLTTGGAALAGQPSIPNMFKKEIVFAAAPMSSMRVFPRNVVLSRRNAPPPYTSVSLTSTLPVTIHPSIGITCPNSMLWPITFPVGGGTMGVNRFPKCGLYAGAVGVWAATGDANPNPCRKVEVWLPNKNMASAPSANDPNARVTFLITPPQNGNGDCTEWKYHYGVKPPKRKLKVVPKTEQASSLAGKHTDVPSELNGGIT